MKVLLSGGSHDGEVCEVSEKARVLALPTPVDIVTIGFEEPKPISEGAVQVLRSEIYRRSRLYPRVFVIEGGEEKYFTTDYLHRAFNEPCEHVWIIYQARLQDFGTTTKRVCASCDKIEALDRDTGDWI